jgi:MerR family transcriptional regulator, thiopeptide resistance regulator
VAQIRARTLHYYDEIGLLSPSHRSDAGYRLYTTGDVVRLQQIRSLRHLGFSLEEIKLGHGGRRTPRHKANCSAN